MMLAWSNIHGGFVAGLGAIAVYTAFSLFTRRQIKCMLFTSFACGAATLVNIYGLKFWAYLIPALLNKRPEIAEWQPLPLFANDVFLNFRILFLLVLLLLLVAGRRTEKKSWPGLSAAGADRGAGVAQPAACAVLRSHRAGICRPIFANRAH